MNKDEEREHRIYNDAIVDCYGEYEVAAGWHCYLDDRLTFPFKAECVKKRSVSPLKVGEVVDVIRMADQDDCMNEMFVIIRFMDREFGVPLAQLQTLDVDEQTGEAAGDWFYWVDQGHQI